MNKKGFTLVELLAVIGLLTIIILLGAPKLINQIESSKNQNYDNFIGDLCLAAESYINHNNNINGIENFNNPNDTITISVGDLMSNGYLKSTKKNPRTNEQLHSTETLRVTLTEDMTYTCELVSQS